MPQHAVAGPRSAGRRLAVRCLAAVTAATATAAMIAIATTDGTATDPTADAQTAARTQWFASARAEGARSARERGARPEPSAGSGQRTAPLDPDPTAGTTAVADQATSSAPRSPAPRSPAPLPAPRVTPPPTASPAHRTAPHAAGSATPAAGTSAQNTGPIAQTPATSAVNGPLGRPGAWSLAFDDEFNGSALDTELWSADDGDHMNDVTTRASNVAVTGGNLVLTLSSATTGAYVNSGRYAGAGKGFLLPVGGYAEARVNLPGNGGTIYNWPAWWISSGPAWPAGGEHDIVEGLGTATVNYHNSSGAHNYGTVPGAWSNSFHVYGIYRAADHADVYWDGTLVRSYPTSDNGAGQALVLNVGNGSYGGPTVTGAASRVAVDYVRAWLPGR